MHISVEKDIFHSLQLMKYVVNHHTHFENPYASFLFGFLSFTIAIHIEINAMIIFTSMVDVLGIVMQYVSIAAIVNIPRYFVSIIEDDDVALKCINLQLKVTHFRH